MDGATAQTTKPVANRGTIPFLRILRVLAMLSIVVGHWCSYAGIYLYDLGGLGVHIFLLISGYLCGLSVVSEPLKWYKKRIVRIMVPLWIWTLILTAIGLVFKKFHLGFFTSMFGLSGLGWILPFSLPTMSGMAHTWYITVILLCYLKVPLFQKMKWDSKKHVCVLFGLLLGIQVALSFFGIQLVFIIQFLIGYYLARNKGRNYKVILPITMILMLAVCAARVFAQRFNIPEVIYGKVIAEWSENLISIFMFFSFEAFCAKWIGISERVSSNKIVKGLDELSYSAYITHYSFLHGVICLEAITASTGLQFVLFVTLTIISSFVVFWIDKGCKMLFSKKKG